MVIRAVISDIGGVLEYTPPTGWQARWETRLGRGTGGFGPEVSLVDDEEAAVAAAADLGMSAIRFSSNAQTIPASQECLSAA